MPYIPPRVLENTQFPTVDPDGLCDLRILNEMIKEKFERSYPEIDYYVLERFPTENEEDVTGVPGETLVDDLWGEDIPTTETSPWSQPHASTTEGLALDATETRVYADAIQINAALELQSTDRSLKKLGIDETKGILVTFPTSLLDEKGIKVKSGDYFLWRGEKYEVETIHNRGYWKNTNVYLYVVADCQRLRIGS